MLNLLLKENNLEVLKFIYPLLLGWFNDRPVAIPEYNWYGAYGNDADAKNDYKDALELDYVFDYPKMHDVVGYLKQGSTLSNTANTAIT